MKERTLWGIHAGKMGDADSLFLQQGMIAVRWRELGDLSQLAKDREAFKTYYSQTYPSANPRSVGISAGQLYRFVCEAQIDDWVAYPAKSTKTIHIGRLTSDYQYKQDISEAYPNQRAVKWLKELPRSYFSLGALN
ncbi:MAG: restriction endonuclease, partial [Gammaproteobacteria bacterium]|nr:restriction endonuclease [Gammaproteobacteria bacterium]